MTLLALSVQHWGNHCPLCTQLFITSSAVLLPLCSNPMQTFCPQWYKKDLDVGARAERLQPEIEKTACLQRVIAQKPLYTNRRNAPSEELSSRKRRNRNKLRSTFGYASLFFRFVPLTKIQPEFKKSGGCEDDA